MGFERGERVRMGAAEVSTGISGQTVTTRVASIDIFRGLTMAVMILVNELGSVRGMPWWTEHAPTNVDVMTYVDMVFPFFLFILGVSMPIAVAQRLKRNASMPLLWLHVFVRAVGLIVLGFILANAEFVNRPLTHMNGGTWAVAGILCAGLYLNVYPKSFRFARALRLIGLAGIVLLYALFRRLTPHGEVAWIDQSYPEILGLIGFTYFATSILYIPTRRWHFMPIVWLVLLTAFCSLSTARVFDFPRHTSAYIWPFYNGAETMLIMAGIVTSTIFLNVPISRTLRRTMGMAIAFAAVMLVAGFVLKPLGISKNRGTPTWSLWSAAAAVLVFALLYWICDVKKRTAWARFVHAAGSNTLLTYLLPDLWFYLMLAMGVTFFETHLRYGLPGAGEGDHFHGPDAGAVDAFDACQAASSALGSVPMRSVQ